MNYEKLKSTELSYRELATVTGVHFTTISRLLRAEGAVHVHPLTKRRLDAVTSVLDQLVESGKLPMRSSASRAKRRENVEKIKNYVDAAVAP